jgi:hypothetical protein
MPRDKLAADRIRRFIEESDVDEVSDEIRAIVELHWPWLLERLPPRA